MEYLFPSPHFQSVCVPRSEVGLCRQHIYRSCFCIHSASLCRLVGAFNPFTFKVIIDMYALIAVLLIVLDLFLGINPDSGGSPPIESRVSMVRVVIMGVLFQAGDSDNVVVVEF